MEVILKMKRSLAKNPSNIIMVIATIMTLILLATTIKVYAINYVDIESVSVDSNDLMNPTTTPADTRVEVIKVSDDTYDLIPQTYFGPTDEDTHNCRVTANTRLTVDGKTATCMGVSPLDNTGYRFKVDSSSSSSSTSSSSSSSKKKDDGKKSDKKSDKKKDSGSDDTPSWVLNPNEMNIGYFIPAAAFPGTYRMGRQEQGPVAKSVFAGASAGWSEAFTFNLTKDGKADASLKNGTMKVTIPSQYIKAGRTFAIVGLDGNGNPHTFNDTDTSDGTVTANINLEGYAFSLIFHD